MKGRQERRGLRSVERCFTNIAAGPSTTRWVTKFYMVSGVLYIGRRVG